MLHMHSIVDYMIMHVEASFGTDIFFPSNLKQEIMFKKLLYAINEGQGSFDLS